MRGRVPPVFFFVIVLCWCDVIGGRLICRFCFGNLSLCRGVVFSNFGRPFAVLVSGARVAFRICIGARDLHFSNFGRLFFGIFRFFRQTNGQTVQVKCGPVGDLYSVTDASVDSDRFYERSVTTLRFDGEENGNTVLGFNVAWSVPRQVWQVTYCVFVRSLVSASTLTTVMVGEGLSH